MNAQNQIEIIGVSEKSAGKKFIKAPFLSILDQDLNEISTHYFKSNTSANNPRLVNSADNQKILSFYKATSLDEQVEKTEIHYLDNEYKLLNSSSVGHKLRSKKVVVLNDIPIILGYSRQNLNIVIKSLSKPSFSESIGISKEPTIPSDIESLNDNELVVCGIENGFHYPDGHDYNQKSAFGFIDVLNNKGVSTKHVSAKTSQHQFFNDIEVLDSTLILTGTEQSDQTSMDLLLRRYDHKLNLMSNEIFEEEGLQIGIKTIEENGFLYTLVRSENLEENKTTIRLVKSNKDFTQVWLKEYGDETFYDPKDLLIADDKIMVISNIVNKTTKESKASLFIISLDGNLISETAIH